MMMVFLLEALTDRPNSILACIMCWFTSLLICFSINPNPVKKNLGVVSDFWVDFAGILR